MARAFRAASPLPLPSSRAAAASVTSGAGRGSFPWLNKNKGSGKPGPQRGGTSAAGQESKGDEPAEAAAEGSAEQSPPSRKRGFI